jgi:hypothetical protein
LAKNFFIEGVAPYQICSECFYKLLLEESNPNYQGMEIQPLWHISIISLSWVLRYINTVMQLKIKLSVISMHRNRKH